MKTRTVLIGGFLAILIILAVAAVTILSTKHQLETYIQSSAHDNELFLKIVRAKREEMPDLIGSATETEGEAFSSLGSLSAILPEYKTLKSCSVAMHRAKEDVLQRFNAIAQQDYDDSRTNSLSRALSNYYGQSAECRAYDQNYAMQVAESPDYLHYKDLRPFNIGDVVDDWRVVDTVLIQNIERDNLLTLGSSIRANSQGVYSVRTAQVPAVASEDHPSATATYTDMQLNCSNNQITINSVELRSLIGVGRAKVVSLSTDWSPVSETIFSGVMSSVCHAER